jgi:hypothetical protein
MRCAACLPRGAEAKLPLASQVRPRAQYPRCLRCFLAHTQPRKASLKDGWQIIADLALDVLRSKYATPEGEMLKTDLELLAARTAMVAVHSAALRDVFVLLDTQQTGLVSTEALAEMLAAVGHTKALPEIEEVCAIGDVDCDGGLDFEELCMMARTGTHHLMKGNGRTQPASYAYILRVRRFGASLISGASFLSGASFFPQPTQSLASDEGCGGCDDTGALDLAELLAFRELKMGTPQIGVPRSKRAMLLLDASRQQLRKQWAELAPAPTKLQMIETPISSMPTPVEPVDEGASDAPMVSPVVEAAAAEAAPAMAAQVAWGAVNEVDTKEHLAAVIKANPGKMVCLMVGFTFCRPCKAFVRPYEVRAHTSLSMIEKKWITRTHTHTTRHLAEPPSRGTAATKRQL